MANAYLRSQLWGSMYQDPAVADEFSAEATLTRMLRFERAWTLALQAVGRIDQEQTQAAIRAIELFQPDFAAFAIGADRDALPVPEFVRQLRSGLSEPDSKAIHTGSTTQDVLDTSFVLASLAILDLFAPRLRDLTDRLDELERQFGDVPLMGRTRMQAALPITVAQRLTTWRTPLSQLLTDLAELKNHLARIQAGGAVGDRDFGVDDNDRLLKTLCAELGLAEADVWHTDRAVLMDLGAWLTKVAGSCAKLGKDVSLMAQQGIEEVKLSGGGGSSAMPHKQNPVRAEVLIALGRFVAGHNAVLGQAMIHEQERSGEAWALEWLTLPTMMEATGASLNASIGLLAQIQSLGTPDPIAL